MKDKMKVAVLGHGGRGEGMLKLLATFKEVEVVCVFDEYPDRSESAVENVFKTAGYRPAIAAGWKEAILTPGVEAVFLFTAWESHVGPALFAMEHGVAVAMEVGGAYDLIDCEKLVEVQERTKVPFMLLENCCFNKEELQITAMARKGLFGEIVHCHGSYAHDLRSEVIYGNENRHYRLRNYMNRCCENYPTHELGPIAKLLNINRGNRILSVVSVASKAAGLHEYAQSHDDVKPELKTAEFKQGDIVQTIITCAGGETISLRLDTTLPRYYNREFTVRGTKGLYDMGPDMVFLDGMKEYWDAIDMYREFGGNRKEYEADYLPDIWKNVTQEQLDAGHGGMDWFEIAAFIDCFMNGKEMPVDVYDAATWMAVTALSERSIAMGGAPQAMPDFTRGAWLRRPPKDVIEL